VNDFWRVVGAAVARVVGACCENTKAMVFFKIELMAVRTHIERSI